MDFKSYYTALLRHHTHTEPRADEAMRDYQHVLNTYVLAYISV